ncbi:hypothetical protein H2513_08835 [Pasteurella multocida]|nr:hypothetical protein H2513_08835 [Pasteurella multocida]
MANGHRFTELQHYTVRQIALFYKKAMKRERAQRAARTVDVAYGVNGGKETNGYLNQLII